MTRTRTRLISGVYQPTRHKFKKYCRFFRNERQSSDEQNFIKLVNYVIILILARLLWEDN
jgi:hypothetical protein